MENPNPLTVGYQNNKFNKIVLKPSMNLGTENHDLHFEFILLFIVISYQ